MKTNKSKNKPLLKKLKKIKSIFTKKKKEVKQEITLDQIMMDWSEWHQTEKFN